MPSLDENSLKAALRAAREAEESGLVVDALRAYQALLRQQPQAVEALLGVGRLTLILGEFEHALEKFTAALIVDPKHPEGYRGRGLAFLNSGMVGRAFADFDRALALAPNSSEARLTRGLAALEEGMLEEAQADLEIALSQSPNDPDAILGVARCHARAFDTAEGTEVLKQALEDALATLEAMIAEDPILELLGAVLRGAEGDIAAAEGALVTALEEEPELLEEAQSYPILAALLASAS